MAMSLLIAATMGSCSKDEPFRSATDGATGKFMKSSLSVTVEQGGPRMLNNRSVRMAAPSADEFTVEFVKDGKVEATYLYSEMPEIVVLPIGTYTAVAHYGENPVQAWEAPYYKGVSETFSIQKDAITDNIAPIVCRLANVRVSVKFDDALRAVMSQDCKVRVVVGNKGSLDFTVNDVDRSGYFAYVEDSKTLAATFTGMVDGAPANETKAYKDVEPGNHYAITFRLHDAGEEDPGNITGKEDGLIHVDATVETTDENIELDPGEVILPDTMRPQEGEDPGKEDPTPDQPQQPDGPEGAPTIVGEPPVNIDGINVLPDDGSDFPVAIQIHSNSKAGIVSFTVKVKMAGVPDSELIEMNLAPEMDLVNPDESYKAGLVGLGFPVEEKVKGQQDVRFDISDLMGMLKILEGLHEFTLTVGDEFGVTSKTLKIQCN